MRTLKSERYFPAIVGIHLVLWALDLSLFEGSFALTPDEDPAQRVLGEVLSSWVVTVFGFNLLMTTRLPWVERIFGGLDKMYLIHRRSGFIAGFLLLLHFAIVPRHPEFSVGKPVGFGALAFIVLGIFFAAAPVMKRRLNYSKWRAVHRLMGPAYVVGVAHGLMVPTLISKLPIVRTYVFGMALVGILSWLYRVFRSTGGDRSIAYRVTEVRRFGQAVIEIWMEPIDQALDYRAGQFAFFSFDGLGPKESHPFTIASSPRDKNLRIAVKASGDFTAELVSKLEPGQAVRVEGPYGHLTQDHVKKPKQLWVAGGIGITPFLSMTQDSQDLSQATLWWTVRDEIEAHFNDELEAAAATTKLNYKLWQSNEDGRLTLDGLGGAQCVQDADVFICGPAALRDSLIRQLQQAGVSASRIHTEEFAFR